MRPIEAFQQRLLALINETAIENRRILVVIAGHNGAGKTTIYDEKIARNLSGLIKWHINPDEVEKEITISEGLNSCIKSEFEKKAAKECEILRNQYLDQEVNFSFETVLSDPVQEKVGFMHTAKSKGYLVILIGVGLESIEKSKSRVAIRHAKGGHNVDANKIESRYARVLANFAHGTKAASLALFFDNSEDRAANALDTYWDIALYEDGKQISRVDSPPDWWLQVEKSAQNCLDKN